MGNVRRVTLSLALIAAILMPPTWAAAQARIVIDATKLEPVWATTITGQRMDFVNRTGGPVHVEFGADPRQHEVVQILATGPIWAIFHRPGTHPYVVHLYGRDRGTLTGTVEVVEDETHKWDSRTCGLVVEGTCLEP